ncbi:MAG: DUF302 domain-containing protein [Hyphomicrobiales bacterium]|nr:DUF302 domain-containing protein [Hyphomicrobiales bacterium]
MVRFLSAVCVALAMMGPAFAQGLIVKQAHGSVDETVAKFKAAVEGAGAEVFAVVDHAKGAMSVGSQVPPVTVVIFGNPKLGTPLIAANPQIGLDLPLKVLIWEEAGETMIGYTDPAALKDRYRVTGADETFATIAGALGKLTDKAAE